VRALVFGLDFYAWLWGDIDWDDIRWDPTDEDVRGRHPRLDAFRDRARERFSEARSAVHRRRIHRQHAPSATPPNQTQG